MGVAPDSNGPPTDLSELKRKSVRGGAFTLVSQGAMVLIQLVSAVVLARLLSPEDYGTIAMVMVVTAFAGLFRDLGLSSAAIQKANLTHAQQSNLFWINILLGLSLTALLAAASPLVAAFYGKPELVWLTLALSPIFLIGSISSQSGALLVREMRFGQNAVANVAGALVGLVVSVWLALHGFRFWSLAWGQLSGAVTTTIILFILSPFRPGLPKRGTGLRDMLKFGANVTAFDLVNYFHRNLDNILIGRVWGTESLGLYSRAYTLLMLPINSIRGPLNSVAFPAMSRLQAEPEAFRTYYRRVASMLALISMPLAAFLFVTSESVVSVLLGPQWSGVSAIFTILATVAFVQPVITLWGMVTVSRGMGRRYLRLGLLNTLCSVIGFLVGLPWGPVGVAVGYAIVTYVTAYPILVYAFRDTPVKVSDFMQSIFRPAISSISTAGLCFAITMLLPPIPDLVLVIVIGTLFLPAYFTILYFLPGGRGEVLYVWRLIRPLLEQHLGLKCSDRVQG